MWAGDMGEDGSTRFGSSCYGGEAELCLRQLYASWHLGTGEISFAALQNRLCRVGTCEELQVPTFLRMTSFGGSLPYETRAVSLLG
jgi:hypothetical protein